MSNFVVTDKTLLTSVDRATDSFLVYDSDAAALKRTVINNALDLTSHPVGIDDIQTLTNKTIAAPTISSPVLSGTITGTFTIAGTPTFPAAVVTLTGSQTLTNKTLTAPTINNATIANPTLTVDTISEHTGANGVVVDGVLLKDSKMNGSYLTDASVTNAKLSTATGEVGAASQAWTPTLTGFSVDPASAVYRYTQVGKIVTLYISQPNNGTSNATGFTITLPVTAATITGMTWGESIGQIVNNSAVPTTPGLAQIVSGGTVLNLYSSSSGATWTGSNGKRIIGLVIQYEVA